MTQLTRRLFVLGATAIPLAACGRGNSNTARDIIDIRVRDAIDLMYAQVPDSRELREKSVGMLMMPLVTKAGFGVGGAYGEGALLIDDATVDYYSFVQGSFGLQIGAQQSAHALFFMTPAALSRFRSSDGWTAGADLEVAVPPEGETLGTSTATALSPVIGVVFGQSGLIAGATLNGAKYSRIAR